MPLQIAQGTPIPPAAEMAEFVAIPAGDDVVYVPQAESNWCWAACFQMIRQHLRSPPLSQLEMATRVCGDAACEDPQSQACNTGQWPNLVANDCDLMCGVSVNTPMSLDDLRTALGYGPVEVAFQKSALENHVALITGLRADGSVRLLDPWPAYAESSPQFSTLANGYQAGSWTRSYSRFAAV